MIGKAAIIAAGAEPFVELLLVERLDLVIAIDGAQPLGILPGHRDIMRLVVGNQDALLIVAVDFIS